MYSTDLVSIAFRKPYQKVPSAGCFQKEEMVEGIMAMD